MIMYVKAKDGKIKLPKEIREKFGKKFRLIECKDRIILLPIAEDPLKELRNEWKDVDKSIDELKENII